MAELEAGAQCDVAQAGAELQRSSLKALPTGRETHPVEASDSTAWDTLSKATKRKTFGHSHLNNLKAGSKPQQPNLCEGGGCQVPFNLLLLLLFVRKVLEQLPVVSLKNSYIFHFAATIGTRKELDKRLK